MYESRRSGRNTISVYTEELEKLKISAKDKKPHKGVPHDPKHLPEVARTP